MKKIIAVAKNSSSEDLRNLNRDRDAPPQAQRPKQVNLKSPLRGTSLQSSFTESNQNFLKQLTKAYRQSSLLTEESDKDCEWDEMNLNPLFGSDSFEGSILEDFPEVKLVVDELKYRLGALEKILPEAKVDGIGKFDDINKTVEIAITTKELDAIKGISDNVRHLLHCFNIHHLKEQTTSSSHWKTSRASLKEEFPVRRIRRHSSHAISSGSLRRLLEAANTPSSRNFLEDMLEPERSHRRHHTVLAANDDMDRTTTLPKELLVKMINSKETAGGRSSVEFIAQTYGGLQLPPDVKAQRKSRLSLRNVAKKLSHGNQFLKALQKNVSEESDKTRVEYLPTEFTRLDLDTRKKLAKLLSWESMKVWGFNAFLVDQLSSAETIIGFADERPSKEVLDGAEKIRVKKQGCPIVLMGWALLASPYSQLAMAKNVQDSELLQQAKQAIKRKAKNTDFSIAASLCKEFAEEDDPEKETEGNVKSGWVGYFLFDKFGVTPKAVCQFLRKVERDYPKRDVNPYHNNIHAADVIQTTHALIQLGGFDMSCAYDTIDIYTILIAAALHDVRHPGLNNTYQVNKQTELALVYNDQSVLENMHASRASYLLREAGGGADNVDTYEGIFGTMSEEERTQIRTGVIRSILSTDMSHHFKAVSKMKGYIDEVLEEIEDELGMNESEDSPEPASVLSRIWKTKHSKLREKLLPYILHLADISNPTKTPDVSIEWTDCCYEEFFKQGEKEESEDLPISPLCDRATTNQADGQVGFITYVVKPAFKLLQLCLPGIEEVLAQLDENLQYWEVLKTTIDGNACNGQSE